MPTVVASKPYYEAVTMYGLYAPAKTPSAIVERLNREAARYLQTQDIRDKLFGTGVETVGNAPQSFAAAITADIARLSKVIKDAGIRAEQETARRAQAQRQPPTGLRRFCTAVRKSNKGAADRHAPAR